MAKRKGRTGQSHTKTPRGLRTEGPAGPITVTRPDGSREVLPPLTPKELHRVRKSDKR